LTAAAVRWILNPMVKYSDDDLDTVFAALSDRTRRHVLQSLAAGDRQVTELANEHEMSLPGFMKHLRVLEDAGLIARSKEGRVVSCELSAQPMQAASTWMSRYEKFWTEKLDSLARYLYQQEELQTWNKPSSPKSPRSTSGGTTPSPRKRSGGRGPSRKR
jgi:DNA-binding transcriptional ArsR family regulator